MELTYRQYCNNRMMWLNAGYSDGKFYIDGNALTEKEMLEKYPIKGILINANDRSTKKGANPDKRKNFLKDEKSF